MTKKTPETSSVNDLRTRAEKLIAANGATLEKISKADLQKLGYELQVHQVELEMQNDQLRQNQAELEDALTKYTDLYDFAPVACLTLDKAGLIREANLTATRLLGVERSQLLNTPLASYILPPDRTDFRVYLEKMIKGGEYCCLEMKLQPRQGAFAVVQLTSSLFRDTEDNPLYQAALKEVRGAIVGAHLRVRPLVGGHLGPPL